jgi:mannose/fructose-specific phosphotransferase system component IIA
VSASPDRLKSLAGCGDAASLRFAVSELCAEFGKVLRIDVFTMAEAEKRRALCLLRLESPAQETELMTRLGGSRFGDDVLVMVDLRNGSPNVR